MKKHYFLIPCLALTALLFDACDDTKGNSNESEKSCDYQGSKCNEDGTALITCNDGVKSLKNCTCVNNACKDGDDDTCDYVGSKCNEEGTALLTCNDGVESSTPCTCVDNACKSTGRTCNYEGSKCNNDGTALLTCTDNSETSKTCECVNDKCQTHGTGNECDYTSPKCNNEGTALLTCVDGEESSEPCDCVDNRCVEHDVQCDFEGQACNENGTALVTCADLTITALTTCTCEDDHCVESCEQETLPTCTDDLRGIYYCNARKELITESCDTGQVCNEGVCSEASSIVPCDFDPVCASDWSGIKRCEGGVQSFTPCDDRYSCDIDEENSSPTCVSAMTSSMTCNESLFRPYCDSNIAYTCESNELVDRNCGSQTCVAGECVSPSPEVHIDDVCNPETFREQCVGEIPVECKRDSSNLNNGHVVMIELAGNCAEKDMKCGVVTKFGLPSAECFEECQASAVGTFRDTCVPESGEFHVNHFECVDIGNGKYGYNMIDHENEACDLGCTQGKCRTYDDLLPDYGEECDPLTADEVCLNASHAGICEVNNSSSSSSPAYVWLVEVCDGDEFCVLDATTTPKSAGCYKICSAGDSPIINCEPHQSISNFVNYEKYECKATNGGFAYLKTESGICTDCSESRTCL